MDSSYWYLAAGNLIAIVYWGWQTVKYRPRNSEYYAVSPFMLGLHGGLTAILIALPFIM